jgi:ABC-2 type transport system permease protein
MRPKTVLILRNELHTAFQTKSFLITTFGIPLAAILVFAVAILLNPKAASVPESLEEAVAVPETQVEGFVDLADIVQSLAVDIPPGSLVEFSNESDALAALDSGDISAYYLIPTDYVRSGDLIYVNPAYRLLSSSGQDWVMKRVLFSNLLANEPERIARASKPMEIQVRALEEEVKQGRQGPLTFFIPYAVMMILYLVIMMASSLLLSSVSDEKKTRVMEILLLSVTPHQLLLGKIVGLGLLGLLQAFVWLGTGYGLLRLGRSMALPPEFQLPASIVAWGLVFFLLGYAVYASLMAALGALVPNIKEASQMVILVIWPLLVPLLLIVPLIEQSHGSLAVGLSLFPFTAPIAMMTRLAVGGVPAWQPPLAACLLVGTAFFVIRGAARAFRAQALLSGQPITPGRYYSALVQRR